MIDFEELKEYPGGEGLEALTRFLGRRIPAHVTFSGSGSDRGRDLIFEERPGGLRKRPHRWLVQCKDHSASKRSVTEGDLGFSVTDKVAQHACDGFLLVTTTVASTGLKSLLESLEIEQKCNTEVWDCHELEHQLWQARNVDLIAQFFPSFYRQRFGKSYVLADEPTFYTQTDMNVEAGAEFDVLDRELQLLVADILDSNNVSKHEKKYLRKAQQHWDKFTSLDGCMQHPPEDGGTMGPVVRLGQMSEHARRRLHELREWWQSKINLVGTWTALRAKQT